MMLLLVMLILKSLLVCAAAGLLLPALRRSSAAARHLICLGALAALLALPLFSLALPGWHLPVLSANTCVGAPLAAAPSAPAFLLPDTSPAQSDKQEAAHPEEAASPKGAAHPEGAASGAPTVTETAAEKQPFPWSFVCLAAYLLGLLMASMRPLLGLWGIHCLSRACATVDDEPALATAAACASLLGLRTPRLCRADVPVPMTWGWRRPVVVLPDGGAEWPADRLRSVLLHELAHVRRRDWPGHRLADLACAVYWFHPLVWLTARRLRAESELACDDLVLASGVPAPDYARHLLEIASALPRTSRRSSAAIAMAQTSQIESRLSMILDKTRTRRTVARRVLLAALIPGTAALVTLAVLRPDAEAQAAPSLSPAMPATTVASGGVSVVLPNGGSPLNFRFTRGTSIAEGRDARQMSFITSPNLTINGTTLFAGITNTDKLTSPWWSATGARLQTPVYDTAAHSHSAGEPNAQNLELAFRLPPAAQGVTVQFKLPQSTFDSSVGEWPGKLQMDAGQTEAQLFASTGGARIVSAAFPPTLKKTSVQIGIASGAWKTAASEARSSGAVEAFEESGTTRTGNQSFILGEPVQSAKDVTLTVSDTSKDDIRVVALDMQGNILFPTTAGGQSVSNLDQITAHFSQPLSQIKAFRVQTRPFQWIEFKDVALKPAQSAGRA